MGARRSGHWYQRYVELEQVCKQLDSMNKALNVCLKSEMEKSARLEQDVRDLERKLENAEKFAQRELMRR